MKVVPGSWVPRPVAIFPSNPTYVFSPHSAMDERAQASRSLRRARRVERGAHQARCCCSQSPRARGKNEAASATPWHRGRLERPPTTTSRAHLPAPLCAKEIVSCTGTLALLPQHQQQQQHRGRVGDRCGRRLFMPPRRMFGRRREGGGGRGQPRGRKKATRNMNPGSVHTGVSGTRQHGRQTNVAVLGGREEGEPHGKSACDAFFHAPSPEKRVCRCNQYFSLWSFENRAARPRLGLLAREPGERASV